MPVANMLAPVKSEYSRMVSAIVFTRPMRSPRMPKTMPPTAHPIIRTEVANPACCAPAASLASHTKTEELILNNGVVSGVRVSNFGRRYDIGARHGVVLACGGFE